MPRTDRTHRHIALRMEALEDRATPAYLVFLGETVGGQAWLSGSIHSTSVSWENELSSSDPWGDWDQLVNTYHGVAKTEFVNDGLTTRAFAAYGRPSGGTIAGFLEAEHTIRALVAGDGEADGTPIKASAVNLGNILYATENGTGTVTGAGGVLASFTGSLPGDQAVEFQTKVGDTLTIKSRVRLDVTPETELADGRSELRVSLVPVGAGPVHVVAKHDAAEAGDTFGTYISGVKLANVFTASVPGTDKVTRKFRLTIDGAPGPTQTLPRVPGGAKFQVDMGRLAGGTGTEPRDYPIKVEALGADGKVVATFEGVVKVVGHFGLDLQVKATADVREPRPVEEARILAGAPAATPKLDFRPGISGVEVAPFYDGKLALSFFNTATGKLADQLALKTVRGGVGTPVSTAYSAGHFRDTDTAPSKFDYDVALTPRFGAQVGPTPRRLSDPEGLRVVALPSWIKKNATRPGDIRFLADAQTAAVYGPRAAAYKFQINATQAYNLDLGVAEDTPFKLFNGLKSGVELEAGFTVYASLFETDDAVARADRMKLRAILLGDPLFNQALDPTVMTVSATLPARTLDRPESITFATANPVDLLQFLPAELRTYDRKFGPWEIAIPLVTTPAGTLNGEARLRGTLKAEVSKLDLKGSLTFGFTEEGRLAFNNPTGTLTLDVEAAARLDVKADVAASVTVFGYAVLPDILKASFEGSVTLYFAAHLEAKFDWNSKTKLVLEKEKSNARLGVGYQFEYDVSVLTWKDDKDESNLQTPNKPPDPTPLWGLPLPPLP